MLFSWYIYRCSIWCLFKCLCSSRSFMSTKWSDTDMYDFVFQSMDFQLQVWILFYSLFQFFVSSGNVTTSTVSSFSTTNNNQWISTTASPIFSPWLIGLMGGLGWDFRDEKETEYYFFSCRYFVSIDDSSFDWIFSSTSFTFKTYYFLTWKSSYRYEINTQEVH